MVNRKRGVACVTTAFGRQDPQPIERSLRALWKLGFERVILVYDSKDPAGRGAAETVLRDPARNGGEVRLLEVEDYGTARRWRYGIREAFRDPDVDWVLNLPGDLVDDPSPENLAGLEKMCNLADRDSMVLGDSLSPNRFKTWFDPHVGEPVTRALFPKVQECLDSLNHSKRRTEFFCVGRNVLKQHDRLLIASWGQDPTIQLLVAAAYSASLTAKSVDLGRLADDDRTRSPLAQLWQIVRFVHQMIEDRIFSELNRRGEEKNGARELSVHRELMGVLCDLYGHGAIMRMVEHNYAELRPRESKPRIPASTGVCLDIRGSSPQSYLDRVLKLIDGLTGFDHIFLLARPPSGGLEERRKHEEAWQAAVQNWKGRCRLVLHYDLCSTRQGPCDDWWRNIWLAFQNEQVEQVIYFPVDLTNLDPPAERADLLQTFIDKATSGAYDLLLGNSEAFTPADVTATFEPFPVPKAVACEDGPSERTDIRKNRLEACAVLILQSLFPKTFADFLSIRDDPHHDPSVRTGFFSLSRELFEAFVKERGTMLPYAGTIQLLLCALIRSRVGAKPFRIGEHFIGRLKHGAEDPTGFSLEHQLLRIEFVIRNEHAYYTRKYPGLPL